MAGGGTFDKTAGKVRAGTYINFESVKQDTIGGGERGTVILPLAGTNYGPAKKMITITSGNLDGAKPLLGYSVADDDPAGNTLLIREALKGASTAIVYICTEGKAAAEGTGGGLKAVARYKGSRGNALNYVIAANPLGGFDVTVNLAGTKVEEFEGMTNASGLTESQYITFTMTAGVSTLSEVAGVNLSGGADAEQISNDDVVTFLDDSGNVNWNTMAFPFTDNALLASLKTKIRYFRENVGKYVQAAAPNFAADYEGIINVTNSYALGDTQLTTAQATAYVAGITAGASNVQSNTQCGISGATEIIGLKDNEAAIAALKAGQFFFSPGENDTVIVESDRNSLVTHTTTKDKSYSKNRVIRVFDTFGGSVQANFPPNKFDNDPDGWDVMEGIGKTILKQYGPRKDGGVGAIKNIDYDKDFLVDREASQGDETYFNIGLEAVDSSEKLFFTVRTR